MVFRVDKRLLELKELKYDHRLLHVGCTDVRFLNTELTDEDSGF